MRSIVYVVAALSLSIPLSLASADERHGEEHRAPERQAPPKFQKHAPGVHPHGATVHSHPVRVMAPKMVVHGRAEWPHWSHPEFTRPVYYWDWAAVHSVTCTAEDSYGDQYPVTENAGPGWGLNSMTTVEDESLDRCYSESGQDTTCYLATCAHF